MLWRFRLSNLNYHHNRCRVNRVLKILLLPEMFLDFLRISIDAPYNFVNVLNCFFDLRWFSKIFDRCSCNFVDLLYFHMIPPCFPKCSLDFRRFSLMCRRFSSVSYWCSLIFMHVHRFSLICHCFPRTSKNFRRCSSIGHRFLLIFHKFHECTMIFEDFQSNPCIVVDSCLNSIVFKDFG